MTNMIEKLEKEQMRLDIPEFDYMETEAFGYDLPKAMVWEVWNGVLNRS